MITITKGQEVPENPTLEVLSPTGEYELTDLIDCAVIGTTEPVATFEARFILLGAGAYNQ